ncbi:hypothetical protein DIPPA_05559 [Diplonema papillatum]|nr:hypothetical protein DIPPA_05559 [Diplonema papillatum]
MATFSNDIVVFEDIGKARTQAAVTVSSWAELCKVPQYSALWHWNDDALAIQKEKEEARKREAKEQKDDQDVISWSSSSSATSSSSSGSSKGKKAVSKLKQNDEDVVDSVSPAASGGEEAEGEDSGTANFAQAMSILRTNHGPKRQPRRSAPIVHGARPQSQFKVVLEVAPKYANRLCLVPLEGRRDSYYVGLNTDEAAVPSEDHTVFSGPYMATVRDSNSVYESTKALVYSAMNSARGRYALRNPAILALLSVNIRYRIRLGRKVIGGRGMENPSLVASNELCHFLNGTNAARLPFIDAISKVEFDRIAKGVEPHKKPGSDCEVVQLHVDCFRDSYRITCDIGPCGVLKARKVKENSTKYTVIDVIRPGKYDYRYDVRTSDNIPPTSHVYKKLAGIVGCFSYSSKKSELEVVEVPTSFFVLKNIRYKRKWQCIVPGAVGDHGTTKVSMSETVQHEVNVRNIRQHAACLGLVSSASVANRYEVGAQLVETKRQLDAFKMDASTLSAPRVITAARFLIPNALHALRQISEAEVVALERTAAFAPKQPQPAAPAGNDGDEDMDSDDEV